MGKRYRSEFLVLDQGETLAVYGPSDFPVGTPVGRDARRLRVTSPERVQQPSQILSSMELDAWIVDLKAKGYGVDLEPFWSNPIPTEIGPSQPLHEAFDELLRLAEHRG